MNFSIFLRGTLLISAIGAAAFIFCNNRDDSHEAEQKFRSCIKNTDYVCAVKLLNEFPPSSPPNKWRRNIGVTLALLGEIDLAIETYENQNDLFYKTATAGAIIAYLTVSEQTERLISFRGQITSIDIHRGALSSAEHRLRRAPKHLQEKVQAEYIDYLKQNINALSSEKNWNGIMANLAWRNLKELQELSNQITNKKLREYVKNNIPKHIKQNIVNHRKDIVNFTVKASPHKLEEFVLKKVVNPATRNGASNRNHQLYDIVAKSWGEGFVEQRNIGVANKFTNAIIAAFDLNGDESCISATYGAIAVLYGRLGQKQKAIEYLDIGQKYIPTLTGERTDDLRDDQNCFTGHLAYINGIRGGLGDKAGFDSFIAKVDEITKGKYDTKYSSIASYLRTSLVVVGGLYTSFADNRRVLDYALKFKASSGTLNFFHYLHSMETALRVGDVKLAMIYAKSALELVDAVKTKTKREELVDLLKTKIIGKEFHQSWLYHNKLGTR